MMEIGLGVLEIYIQKHEPGISGPNCQQKYFSQQNILLNFFVNRIFRSTELFCRLIYFRQQDKNITILFRPLFATKIKDKEV